MNSITGVAIGLMFTAVCMTLLSTSEAGTEKSCEYYENRKDVPHFECTHPKITHLGGTVTSERQCFVWEFKCDSIIDCDDKSDEDKEQCSDEWEEDCISDFQNKMTRDGKPLQKFKCNNGQCIKGCHQCDGTFDCVDESDEDISQCQGANRVRPPCN